eukprot:TRINITY_DN1020_c0_g2_i4.p1 TRINITY_DN1020_c0_g2~~TRINITY_DN1020_c0_g2_i4.p1  ORF type:complete len:669 (+),score=108.34 TRINITY_DN1020_c0_g2_i4:169-2175(+)
MVALGNCKPAKHWNGGWARDLTRECIEPNPGPITWYAIVNHRKWSELEVKPNFQLMANWIRDTHTKAGIKAKKNLDDVEVKRFLQWADENKVKDLDEEYLEYLPYLKEVLQSLKESTIKSTGDCSWAAKLKWLESSSQNVLIVPQRSLTEENSSIFGREEQFRMIIEVLESNCHHHNRKSQTKQDYTIILLAGSIGEGKTRLAIEVFKKWRHKKNLQVDLYVDFSRGDFLDTTEKHWSGAHLIGFRLLARFMGVPSMELRGLDENEFTLQKVLNFIRDKTLEMNKEPSTSSIILNVLLDEFHFLPPTRAHEILNALAEVISQPDHRVIINVITTSTVYGRMEDLAKASKLSYLQIQLLHLREGSARKMFLSCLRKSKAPFLPSFQDPKLRIALQSTGFIARHVIYFAGCFQERITKGPVLIDDLRGVLCQTMDYIANDAKMKSWEELLTKHLNGAPFQPQNLFKFVAIGNMVRLALIGKRMQLTDHVNGLTVEEARDAGVFEMDTDNRIIIPNILLRALNNSFKIIDDYWLDPLQEINADAFERIVFAHRHLVNTLTANIDKRTSGDLRYGTLYSGALGWPQDLERLVPTQGVTSYVTAAEAPIQSDLSSLSVNGGDTINAMKRSYFIKNKIMGVGPDATITFPEHKHLENHQAGNILNPEGDLSRTH